MDQKTFLGLFSIALNIIGYTFYLRNIFIGKTKPHAFSWLIWAMLTGTTFAAQWLNGGGSGSWVMGFTSVICTFIFFLSLFKGSRDIQAIDWLFLMGALSALLIWWLTKEPTLSLILIVIVDFFGFLPSFRKSFYKPEEETGWVFGLDAFKFGISLFALEQWVFATWFVPLALVFIHIVYFAFVYIRRWQLAQS